MPQELKDIIKQNRPSLSQSSITTYHSILTNLHKKVFPNTDFHLPNLKDFKIVLNHLGDMPSNKRKTILASLVVVFPEHKEYKDLMMSDIQTYQTKIQEQEKTETQKENWVNADELDTTYGKLKRNAELLMKKSTLTMKDLQEIQNYILLVLLGYKFIPPRRAKDYTDFRIGKNINKSTDNYLDKNELVFNSYKTAKSYGEQRVKIPIKMKNILSKWITINPTEYLLFDRNEQPLTSVKLNQRLNAIFDGKKISVNALRHSYLTDKYGSTIETKKALAKDMSAMGSSTNMAVNYIKEE